jgi:serine/threonine protein kinase
VYRAADGRQPVTAAQVALKVSRLPLEEQAYLLRYRREAELVRRLRHPHIVRVVEHWETADTFFIAFELISGRSLRKYMCTADWPEPRRAVRWVKELADALAHAHDNPDGAVVHRDIKPSNIMIDSTDRAILVDFGLGKQLGVDTTMTPGLAALGTYEYMSPEAASFQADQVDCLSDQYSLGVVLYELLTHRQPYTKVRGDVIAQILAGQPERPSLVQVEPRVPLELEAICLRAMSRERERRYLHVRDLSQALGSWLG